jgi:phosphopantothenoylcysteine synthetase/decarboxylase
VNDVSGGRIFGADDTRITILDADGVVADVSGDKNLAAHAILDAALGVATREENP